MSGRPAEAGMTGAGRDLPRLYIKNLLLWREALIFAPTTGKCQHNPGLSRPFIERCPGEVKLPLYAALRVSQGA